MSDKIELTEEQAKHIMEKITHQWDIGSSQDKLRRLMKEWGWIKQSPVEKAHGIMANLSITPLDQWNVTVGEIDTLVQAIRYLEDQRMALGAS